MNSGAGPTPEAGAAFFLRSPLPAYVHPATKRLMKHAKSDTLSTGDVVLWSQFA